MIKLEKGIFLKDFSTFKIGGIVDGFCRIKNEEELKDFFLLAEQEEKPVFVLGGGSNILFKDDFWDIWVAKIENKEEIKFLNENELFCSAGVSLSTLVNFAKNNNFSGLEWAVGIPGTVGGAIRGNAGAFGSEIKDSLKEVKIFDWGTKQFQEKKLKNSACEFGYRKSIFKRQKKLLIWEAIFSLERDKKENIEKKMQVFLEKRVNSQPSLGEFPSLGSVFINPLGTEKVIRLFEKEKHTVTREKKVPAGWLIEKCGLKGKIIGGAQISQKQANFIVNLGTASAQDVRDLIIVIKKEVKNKFGIEMKEEIEIIK